MCDRRPGTYRGSTGRRRGSLTPSGHGGTEFRIRVIPRGFGKLGVTASNQPLDDLIIGVALFGADLRDGGRDQPQPIGGDGADALTIGDQVRDESITQEGWLQNIAIREALRRLSEREQRIINLRFFQGRTQMEVASEIGISQAQVSRLEKAALSHMRS